MRRKLPSTAFDAYVSLGAARSYEAVARQFGVTKRAATACAEREDWQGRLADAQEKARVESDRKAADELVAMNARHDGVAAATEATQRVRRTSRGLEDGARPTQAAEPVRPAPSPRTIVWRLMNPERAGELRAQQEAGARSR